MHVNAMLHLINHSTHPPALLVKILMSFSQFISPDGSVCRALTSTQRTVKFAKSAPSRVTRDRKLNRCYVEAENVRSALWSTHLMSSIVELVPRPLMTHQLTFEIIIVLLKQMTDQSQSYSIIY